MTDGASPLPDRPGPPPSASVPPPSLAAPHHEPATKRGFLGLRREEDAAPALHELPPPSITLSAPEPDWELAPPPPGKPLVPLLPESHEGPPIPPSAVPAAPVAAVPVVAEVPPQPEPVVIAPPPVIAEVPPQPAPVPAPEPELPALVPEIDPVTGAELPISRSPAEMLMAAGVLAPSEPVAAAPAPVVAAAPEREPDVPEGLEGVRTPAQILQQIQRGEAAAEAVQAQLAAQEASQAQRRNAA